MLAQAFLTPPLIEGTRLRDRNPLAVNLLMAGGMEKDTVFGSVDPPLDRHRMWWPCHPVILVIFSLQPGRVLFALSRE